MRIRLCLIMTCLLLAACQTQRAKISSLWSSDEVVEDVADTPYADEDNMHTASYTYTASTHMPAEVINDKNKLLTLTDVSGNREYLILDSISQERGIVTALIEFHYVKPQTLPANGMIYNYNQWREQIDCKNKVRILRNTTHYNAVGEVVDTRDYPLPKYKPAELAALSQPEDKVIQQVCERVGEKGLAVGDVTVVSDGVKDTKKAKTKNPDSSVADKKGKNKKGRKNEENVVKVEEKIDFISKGKTEAISKQSASDVVTTEQASSKQSVGETSQKNKASDKQTNQNIQPSSDERPVSQSVPTSTEDLESGEIPLKPL